MEVKEADRVVIAKPVASRPICSTLRSFSELLAGAINSSPPKSCSETAFAAIRPKTVRVKPLVVNHAPVGMVSSQAEVSGVVACQSSDTLLKSDSKSTVVYKPLAKLVSKTTISLLANLGNYNPGPQQGTPQGDAHVKHPYQDNHNLRSHHDSYLHQGVPSQAETERRIEPSKAASQNMEEDQKSLQQPAAGVDRPSYDGYNWRKYGQKQVKGSEYPRSYYKCTHPNCPVKKKVERSFDGQIAEIVYKGEHSHPKPLPPKRSSSAAQAPGIVSDGTGQDTNIPIWNNHLNERNEGPEGRIIENQNDVAVSGPSTYPGKTPLSYDHVTNAGNATPDNSCGISGDCEEGSKGMQAEDDEPKSKRRKSEIPSCEVGTLGEAAPEARLIAQNSPDSEILGDGFRWRKYGQKVVKGNPYPRSYYRCTSLKCNVRKHVERSSDDPKAFITTYEGKHNHEMPIRNTNQTASEPADSQASTFKNKP